ncbi:hypothetical protein [Bacillus sp. V5-8f]|uniref:hypothetical protein n=1 Tax=Bacillus sp. V5-8f TaxID=2053044 RepID=UPI000C794CA4|nr:hypothetical protein [Bacillus sp. V5-8f]PLT35148.1 hypothetical protein CUU64_07145 [Bacillus sp. V5-8f]
MKSKIHRCNCKKVWTVQNRKVTMSANTVLLNGDWITEVKPDRSSNPKGFVTTSKSDEIILNPSIDFLTHFNKVAKLIYDKQRVYFNVSSGKYLYFDVDGSCYILSKRNGLHWSRGY